MAVGLVLALLLIWLLNREFLVELKKLVNIR